MKIIIIINMKIIVIIMIIMAEMAVSTCLATSERKGADGLQFTLLFLQRNKSIKNASRFIFMKRLFL